MPAGFGPPAGNNLLRNMSTRIHNPRAGMNRRKFVQHSAALAAGVAWANELSALAAEPAIALGSRRELFVDDFLIDQLKGAALKLHQPVAADVALVCDAPWEGNISAYYTLFEDGGVFRAYYRAGHYDTATKKSTHPEFTCLAESRDGLTFTKPALGLFEFQGSKQNNIIWTGEASHNFTPFKDGNPACAPDARYKALARDVTTVGKKKTSTLLAFKSPDGIHWSLIQKEPVISDGAFDSQNLAFWDALRGEYRAYWRIFANKVRAIRTATSKDFIHWDNHVDLAYGDAPAEHLYTNAVMPYFRAPHLFVGFPTRFQPKTQQVEPVFMTSRDGVLFKRWPEELVPITAPKERDGNRSNYMTRGLLQLPGHDRELSVYATEAYYAGPGSRIRRFVYRLDGFVSVRAESAGGLLVTKPLTFAGTTLSLNIISQGDTRVELQGPDGQPLPGFGLNDCTPIRGDNVAHAVAWKGGSLKALAGKPVRVRFELREADLYSLQFGQA